MWISRLCVCGEVTTPGLGGWGAGPAPSGTCKAELPGSSLLTRMVGVGRCLELGEEIPQETHLEMDEQRQSRRNSKFLFSKEAEDPKGAGSTLIRIDLDLSEYAVLALPRSHWGLLVHCLSPAGPYPDPQEGGLCSAPMLPSVLRHQSGPPVPGKVVVQCLSTKDLMGTRGFLVTQPLLWLQGSPLWGH